MNIMIDLETLATSSNAAIISLGAVKFSDDIIDTFYSEVDLQSCLDLGMEVSGPTINWWVGRNNMPIDGIDIYNVLTMFSQWVGNNPTIWGNGASFDNVILTNAYTKCKITRPWHFTRDRCYRTMKNVSDVPFKMIGNKHNALDDARSQALHLIKILEKL